MAVLVKEEMNKNVRTLGKDSSVKDAAEMMAKYWMGSVVITEGEKVVGILTERDVLSKLVTSGKDPAKVKIRDVMSKGVITIEEDKPIDEAVKLMKAHDIKKLPVMSEGKLSGIITTTDIITSMDKELKEKGATLESYRNLKVLVRRHSINIKDEAENNQIMTFLISNSLYPMDSVTIIKAVHQAVPKLLYVTLNKPYYSIVKTLKGSGINTESFYFIDASSGEASSKKGANFESISGQSDLTEMLMVIENNLKKKKFDGVVFDSISTLLAYQDEEIVIRFAHSLMNKLREFNVKGIFLCTKEDLKTSLMKNLNMLADYSVDIDKRRELS